MSTAQTIPGFTASGNDFLDIILYLARHFYYFYPGFITLVWYGFLKSRNFKENKESVVKCLVISFVYVHFLLPLIDTTVFAFINARFGTCFTTKQNKDLVLIVVSVLLPYLWWIIQDSKLCRIILGILNIPTCIHDNPFDFAFSKEPCVWVRAFMDEKGIMYKGYLRHYISDLEKMQYIMISHAECYDIAEYAQKKEEQDEDEQLESANLNNEADSSSEEPQNTTNEKKPKKKLFSGIKAWFANIKNKLAKKSSENGSQEWVILDRSQISRIEIMFEDEH